MGIRMSNPSSDNDHIVAGFLDTTRKLVHYLKRRDVITRNYLYASPLAVEAPPAALSVPSSLESPAARSPRDQFKPWIRRCRRGPVSRRVRQRGGRVAARVLGHIVDIVVLQEGPVIKARGRGKREDRGRRADSKIHGDACVSEKARVVRSCDFKYE